ncbi:uncharacterized protein LOC132720809 [Ruditapes philippinarum]|uniref:uncharacterized protein LOC132720809 n=1 Tax=Ruditapes philippinarum TaxID=129788 RepID=UPI00295C0B9E|nr:uncharacterized protein LOC132720809 [Ruditapes philippinarum]
MSFSQKIPPEWTFNCFLDEVVCNLDQNHETFLRLKRNLEGYFILLDNCLRDAKTADDLFEKLKDKRLLTRYNIDFLHYILHELGDVDILMQLMTRKKLFSTEIGFQSPAEDAPERGFEHITTFMQKENASTFDMAMLYDFKANFSSFLMIPLAKSFIIGIEPYDNGLKITFGMPEMYVHVFEKWTSENSCDEVLKSLHIETILTRNQVFLIKGQEDKTPEEESRLKGISALYNDIQERTKDLNRAEEFMQKQIDQLGKIGCLPDRLLKLHTKSGMSVTLWKTLVKTRNGKLASHYIPLQNHIELEKQSLHSKIVRIYPHIKEPFCGKKN